MDTFIYFLLGLGYLCLLTWGCFLSKGTELQYPSNVLLLVIAGLIYDNVILALGRFIGEGNVLESLSYLRFWLHALFTPTLILFAWNICRETGLPWARTTFWKVLAILMTSGLILYELFASVKGLKLDPKWKNGVLTYESVGHSTSPIMVSLVTLVLGIAGFILIKKFHFPWLFIGTIAMIPGSILTIWIKNFPIMNIFEFVLIVSLLMTMQFQIQYQKNNRLT